MCITRQKKKKQKTTTAATKRKNPVATLPRPPGPFFLGAVPVAASGGAVGTGPGREGAVMPRYFLKAEL